MSWQAYFLGSVVANKAGMRWNNYCFFVLPVICGFYYNSIIFDFICCFYYNSIIFDFSTSDSDSKYGSINSPVKAESIVHTTASKLQDVRIGAFNVERFGKKKLQDEFVVGHLLKASAFSFTFIFIKGKCVCL